jgi:uncharacterized membrane protein
MNHGNANARLEALSDGVFAIAMTLLVIEVRAPEPESIHGTTDLWGALRQAMPTIAAFLLSFTIIFITWVNHHALIRSIPRTSASFLFANGFLLLTVAFIPFPTALLGEFVLTDHGAPAVVLYNAVLAVQAVAWILISRVAGTNGLTRDDQAAAALRLIGRSGYGALGLYALLAVVAVWLPLPVALVTTVTWVVWLVMSLRAKHA